MTLLGFDISNNQPSVNHQAARRAGARFCYSKVSEGTQFVDRLWTGGRPQSIRKAGMRVGGYHFARMVNDPDHEAAWFLHCLDLGGGRRRGDLPCCLDFEDPGNTRSTSGNYDWIDRFSRAVRKHTGRGVILYGSPYYLDEHLTTLPPLARIVWIAAYPQLTIPNVVRRSKGAKVLFHQYTDRGNMPGVPGGSDLDVFFGNGAQLAWLCR